MVKLIWFGRNLTRAKVGINPKSNPKNPKSSPALEKDWKSKSNSQFHMEWKSKSNPRANPLVNTFNKKIFYGEPYDVLLDWDDICFNKQTSKYYSLRHYLWDIHGKITFSIYTSRLHELDWIVDWILHGKNPVFSNGMKIQIQILRGLDFLDFPNPPIQSFQALLKTL